MKISYNQAARLLERMETEGIVTAMGSSGSRSIVAQAEDKDAPQPGRIIGEKMAAAQIAKLKSDTVKYRGPNGETWSGRGLRPKWLTVLLNAGATLEAMEVSQVQPEVDPLYTQALALIIREQKASVRLLKSELSIGTDKAMEVMALLEQAGHVSTVGESGARKVLVAA